MPRKIRPSSLGEKLETRSQYILQDWIKEESAKVYSFCSYLLPAGYPTDELLLQIYRKFGSVLERSALSESTGVESDKAEWQYRLYLIAWEMIQESVFSLNSNWSVDKDARLLKEWDLNLLDLQKNTDSKNNDLNLSPSKETTPLIIARLRLVDLEFRAPLVLKDILGFSDDSGCKILGLRHGVYRHRLNRGRLDFQEFLLGSNRQSV